MDLPPTRRALLASTVAALAACGDHAQHSMNGVAGAQPWTTGSAIGAGVMVLIFVGSPVALVAWSYRKKPGPKP